MIKGHVTPHYCRTVGRKCIIELLRKDGSFAGEAIIDTRDMGRVLSRRWHLQSKGYVSSTLNGKAIKLHNFILGVIGIDHKNHNKLDNRSSNLRAVSHSQNMHNLPANPRNTSGYKGVSMSEKGRWHASIRINGAQYQKNCATRQQAIAQRRKWERAFAAQINLP